MPFNAEAMIPDSKGYWHIQWFRVNRFVRQQQRWKCRQHGRCSGWNLTSMASSRPCKVDALKGESTIYAIKYNALLMCYTLYPQGEQHSSSMTCGFPSQWINNAETVLLQSSCIYISQQSLKIAAGWKWWINLAKFINVIYYIASSICMFLTNQILHTWRPDLKPS